MTTLAEMRLLVLDDNAQMRQLIGTLARAGGMADIVEAASGPEALQILRTRRIDIMLVDWKMAPIDGLAFTRMIRCDSASPNPYLPIIMLTAHTEASRVAAARDAGVSGFVRKPISTRLLFDRIASALTDRRLFIRSDSFCGPDRRRLQIPGYRGPFRRLVDGDGGGELDIDDLQWSA